MFSQGVESLLRQEPGVDIVGRETDVDKAIERIEELQPDVVIVDRADPAGGSMLVALRILREGVRSKVIGLNLQDKTIGIHRGEQQRPEGVKVLV